jgi:hypothetical protein
MNSKTKIINKPAKELYGYDGMNKDAAKVMGFPWRYGNQTIIIDENLHGHSRATTKLHELVEKRYMDQGLTYWSAHKKATAAEKLIKKTK